MNESAHSGLRIANVVTTVVVEDTEERALKKRTEVVSMELENSHSRLLQEHSLKTLETCNTVISACNCLSERDDLTAMDKQLLTSYAHYQLNAIVKGGSPDSPELTTVAKEAIFYGFPRDTDTLRAVGWLVSDAYFKEHGQQPAKPFGSDPRYWECVYQSSALKLIHSAFEQHQTTK
jgi:hypothetical protein